MAQILPCQHAGRREISDRAGRIYCPISDPLRDGFDHGLGRVKFAPVMERSPGTLSTSERSPEARCGGFLGAAVDTVTNVAIADEDLVDLACDVDRVCRVHGRFTLRSGIEADEYFDKFLFEADPRLLRRVVDRMVPLRTRMSSVESNSGVCRSRRSPAR